MGQSKKPNGYQELDDLYKRAMDVLTNAAAPLALLVGSGLAKEGPAKVEADRLAAALKQDIKDQKARLDRLRLKHSKPPNSNDPVADHFTAITIGNEYQEVLTSIISATLPISQDISALIIRLQGQK